MNIFELNQKFSIQGQFLFADGEGGLPIVKIANPLAHATVSLYGAHILSYCPAGETDLLWMSEKCIFKEGVPIRGGIPVCFPWFGPHPSESQKPMHGFARLMTWEVLETATAENGASLLRLELTSNAQTRVLWPYSFRAEVTFVIGSQLEVSLKYTNTGDETFVCSDGLHSYLKVGDISQISLSGLNDHSYYQGMSDELFLQKEADLQIQNEENRRYLNHHSDCVISDKALNRKISVAKKGSEVTVVWNPGAVSVLKMADIPSDGYQSFICVETVNLYQNTITVAPNKSFTVSTVIGLEK